MWPDEVNPQADCGTTAAVLSPEFERYPEVHVHQATKGDLFVAILNHGIHAQYARGVTHTLIISYQIAHCITRALIDRMKDAVEKGACVVTVAFDEIAPLVERGMVCNSCALWDIKELIAVGGFDSRDTKPKGDADHYASSPAGVGEILPLIAIRERLKRPVHAILCLNQKIGYMAGVSSEKAELNRKKFESKQRRLTEMLTFAQRSYKDLELTIMSGYPR